MILRSRLLPFAVALVTAVATLHLPRPAVAQDYDEETIAAVNQHFRSGAQLYYDGDYDAAIVEFEAAHAKIPNAIFLYNISLAQAKKGETDASLATAEAAQEFGGLGADEQVQNSARITAMRRVKTSESAAADIGSALPPVDPLLNFSTMSWIGLGVGVAGLIGWGVVYGIDRSLAPDVRAYKAAASRGDAAEYQRLKDDLRPRQSGARALFVVSSLAVIGGAGLLVYDLVLRKDDTMVAIAPMVGGVGAVLTHRF